MPLQATSGAASYDAFGGGVAAVPQYIEDVFSTYLYTGNGTSQVIENGINLGTSNSGGSGYFDGSGDYLSVANNSAFDILSGGNFTVECFVYFTSLTDNGGYGSAVIAKGSFNGGWILRVTPTNLGLVYPGVSANYISKTFTSGQWYHIVAQRESTTMYYYVNGERFTPSYTDKTTDLSTALTIGNCQTDTNTANVTGYIGAARIVKGTAVYSGTTITVPTAPLTAASGTSLLTLQSPTFFTDASSNNFTITRNGDVVGKSFGPFTSAIAGKGGLVWIKGRDAATDHRLQDTTRGTTSVLRTNNANAAVTGVTDGVTSFNTTGFALGANGSSNNNTSTYASWTFRKQPKFFDVVTFTSSSAGDTTFNHNLGVAAGCIILKNTQSADGWVVYHRSVGNNAFLRLNTTAAQDPLTGSFSVTSTSVTVNASLLIDNNTYVAYLFAHDAGGFGLTGTDNVISCGSFTTDGSGNATVNLGYEAQWVLMKKSSGAESWMLFDNMRGLLATVGANGYSKKLVPNLTDAESDGDECRASSTGFNVGGVVGGATYIYVAIRRGPMKVPTTGTSVYETGFDSATLEDPTIRLSNLSYVDTAFAMRRTSPDSDWPQEGSRLTQGEYLRSSSTAASVASAGKWRFNFQNGFGGSAWDNDVVAWCFRRAPSFHDVVCYTGTGSNTTVTHNLQAIPELIIVKRRSAAASWAVYSEATGNTKYLQLQTNNSTSTDSTYWNSTTPTSTVFSLGTSATPNQSTQTYIAYLFATCAGVSKVGSYTGTGTTLQVNCGFTGGARFVLIKRTDASGDWYVWDSARGIVAGNDPYLLLNDTAAEVTNTDYIDTYSAGFEISSTAPSAINASGGTFIFLAIA